ncbi:MAG: hypothetical protein EKK55_20105 [Rhodocyclaceae bacterium]|nr:MAG: hypothetical protein EKK55_20105 [Rhodocyclaceae bacterium]
MNAPALVLTMQGEGCLGASAFTLRDYQCAAVDGLFAKLDAGIQRVCVVSPTGSGKGPMIGATARRALERGWLVQVWQHRDELISQNWRQCELAGIPAAWLGVIRGGDARRNPVARVQLVSVPTLAQRVARGALPPVRLILIDEAHRSAAESYAKILRAYGEEVFVVGWTATPWRLDGKGLSELFDDALVVATIPELIGRGFLTPLRCYTHPKGPDLSGVKVRGGDFDEAELAAKMRSSLLLGSVVDTYALRAKGRAAIGFAVNVAHAHELDAVCKAAGLRSAVNHGEMDLAARTKNLRALDHGGLDVLWNVQLHTEGTDVTATKAVILVRPTLSRALAFQMIGRGMRPHASFPDCVVLDHAGVLPIHGHPLEPQDYSLAPPKKARPGAGQTKDCPECQETVALGTTLCPTCGHVWEREERKAPTVVPGQLVEVAPRPGIVLRPKDEEAMIRAAFGKAATANARVPSAYARSILEKQLRRAPDRALFERVALELQRAKPAPAPAPAWLANQVPGLAAPAPAIVPPSAPFVPAAPAAVIPEHARVRVAF